MFYVKEYYFDSGQPAAEIASKTTLTIKELAGIAANGYYEDELDAYDYYITPFESIEEAMQHRQDVLNA